MSKTLIVVAVLCVAILGAFLVLPMTPFWGAAPSGPVQAAQNVGKSFLEDLAAGRIKEARAQSSQRFQQSHSPEDLAALAGVPALKKLSDVRFHSIGQIGNEIRLSGATNGYQGSAPVTMVLVQDNGKWLVDLVEFP